ncbi:hypothetical protein LCGC14_0389800 [marine sediment metagenome]|uniref:Uncharacterized protein n=1 Tax=marine sediment metagenome TaxID=412755 RepID=A0A0F9W909_9ZZZZ
MGTPAHDYTKSAIGPYTHTHLSVFDFDEVWGEICDIMQLDVPFKVSQLVDKTKCLRHLKPRGQQEIIREVLAAVEAQRNPTPDGKYAQVIRRGKVCWEL